MDRLENLIFTFFNVEIAVRYLPDILRGMWVTFKVSVAVIVTGLAIGYVLALLRARSRRWISIPIVVFADIFRALPPLVLLIIFFFAFPYIQIPMSAFKATWIALALVLGAYAEESLWAGIRTVPPGQMEAARSTGLSWLMSMVLVVLPQAIRISLPALTNRVISITKNTALGAVIALSEILNNAQSASSNSGNPTPMTLGAFAFLVIFVPLVVGSRYLEAKSRWKR